MELDHDRYVLWEACSVKTGGGGMFVEMKRYSNVNVCRSGRLLRETRAFRVGCAVPRVSYCDRLEQWAGQWVYARPSVL